MLKSNPPPYSLAVQGKDISFQRRCVLLLNLVL